jgi:hypothetical protein
MIGRPFQEAERCLTGQRGRPGPGCHRRPGVDPSWARWPVSKQVCLEGETAISTSVESSPCLLGSAVSAWSGDAPGISRVSELAVPCGTTGEPTSAGPPSISVDPPPGTTRPPMPWTAISERLATLAKVTCRVPGPPLLDGISTQFKWETSSTFATTLDQVSINVIGTTTCSRPPDGS